VQWNRLRHNFSTFLPKDFGDRPHHKTESINIVSKFETDFERHSHYMSEQGIESSVSKEDERKCSIKELVQTFEGMTMPFMRTGSFRKSTTSANN